MNAEKKITIELTETQLELLNQALIHASIAIQKYGQSYDGVNAEIRELRKLIIEGANAK